MVNKPFKLIRNSLALVLVLLLGACSSDPSAPPTSRIDLPALSQPLEYNGEFYLRQAELGTQEQQFAWKARAAMAFYGQQQNSQANALYQELAASANTESEKVLVLFLKSLSASAKNNELLALSTLDQSFNYQLNPEQQIWLLQQRASIYGSLVQTFAKVQTLLELSNFLELEQRPTEDVNQQIWFALNSQDSESLRNSLREDGSLFDGWVEAAAISQQADREISQLSRLMNRWQQQYPEHPAAKFFSPSLLNALELSVTIPQKVAVLLPLSGKYQNIGVAVRNGLVSAFIGDKQRDDEFELVFYDTQDEAMEELYPRLLENGHDFIVGPLIKESLEELLALSPTLPLLALNSVKHDIQSNYFFFPLDPEDEAIQAAQHLLALEHQQVLILAPNNNLGKRMSNAFNQEWQKQVDHPVDTVYFNNMRDLQASVERLYHIDRSNQRINQLTGLLNVELKSEPRSRRDSQAVYLVANHAELKLMKPFIDVTISPFAPQPTIYTSSRAYLQNLEPENDLNGIVVSEMPWMLDQQSILAIDYSRLWPRSNDTSKRLYALGYDAYNLLHNMYTLRSYPDFKFAALSGELSIEANGQIERKLQWVEYQNGFLAPLQQELAKQTMTELVETPQPAAEPSIAEQ